MTPTDREPIECFFDGACPGNQSREKGPMRAAFVIGDLEFVRDVPELQTPRGPLSTNNIAEYQALIWLLEHLQTRESQGPPATYRICGDSQLVIRQMTGEYRVKQRHLMPLNERAMKLAAKLRIEWKWVPRDQNRAGRLLE